MEKRSEWFELVIHKDEAGTRATVSKRTRLFNDDGTVDHSFAPVIEGHAYKDLGDEFPWDEFLNEAVQAALLKAEATDQLAADLAAAQATVTQKDAEIATYKATIEDREKLILVAKANIVQMGDWLGAEIAARTTPA